MFVIVATWTKDNSQLSVVPFLGSHAWGDKANAMKFATADEASKFFKANKPRAQFCAGRIFDVVPA